MVWGVRPWRGRQGGMRVVPVRCEGGHGRHGRGCQRVGGVVACPEMVGSVSGAGWSCGKLAELAVHRGCST